MHDVDVISHCRLWILVDYGDHEEFGLYVCETGVGGGGGGCGVSGEFFPFFFPLDFLSFFLVMWLVWQIGGTLC